MKPIVSIFAILVIIGGAILLNAACYTVDMREQVIITQFQQVIGQPVTTPGLHFKAPFVQTVNRFSNQVMEWDGPSTQMPTKDKVYIVVDTFGRWRITDPLKFMQKLANERSAHSRLNDLLGSETRSTVAKHDLIEVVRTTKGRKAARDATLSVTDSETDPLPPIEFGRSFLEKEILASSKPKVEMFGIELMDIRFKRINYNPSVSRTIHSRMKSEREQIAERFRSEGAGEAAKILGNRDRDLKQIESEAYKKIQEIEGEADAKATEIYAKAYNQTPEALSLYDFTKSMTTLRKTLTLDTTLVLTTDSDFLRFLKTADPRPGAPAVTAPSPSSASPAPKTVPGPKLDIPKTGGIPGLPSLLDLPAR
ncbi:MAG: protease modulator HflC [Verrucomicrobiaceae bacterium]|nr:protease modulator HflC [Verrucomicrobiaceae bacterium]